MAWCKKIEQGKEYVYDSPFSILLKKNGMFIPLRGKKS